MSEPTTGAAFPRGGTGSAGRARDSCSTGGALEGSRKAERFESELLRTLERSGPSAGARDGSAPPHAPLEEGPSPSAGDARWARRPGVGAEDLLGPGRLAGRVADGGACWSGDGEGREATLGAVFSPPATMVLEPVSWPAPPVLAPDASARESARAITAWLARACVELVARRESARLRVHAPRLGAVSVELRVHGGSVMVGVDGSREATDALIGQKEALAADLAGRGLRLGGLLPCVGRRDILAW